MTRGARSVSASVAATGFLPTVATIALSADPLKTAVLDAGSRLEHGVRLDRARVVPDGFARQHALADVPQKPQRGPGWRTVSISGE
jgi:hypothetical protein